MVGKRKMEGLRKQFVKVSSTWDKQELSTLAKSYNDSLASMARQRMMELEDCYFELEELDENSNEKAG